MRIFFSNIHYFTVHIFPSKIRESIRQQTVLLLKKRTNKQKQMLWFSRLLIDMLWLCIYVKIKKKKRSNKKKKKTAKVWIS